MSAFKDKLADDFLKAIELEQQEDVQLTQQLLSTLSPKKLEEKGLAILNLSINNLRTGLNGKLLIELINDNSINPEKEINNNDISIGDIVKVEKIPTSNKTKKKKVNKNSNNNENDNKQSIEAVITKVTSKLIVITIEENDEEKLLNLENDRLWMVKITNNVTYRRMESTMRKLKEQTNLTKLMEILLQKDEYFINTLNNHENKSLKFFNENLNESQKNAIKFSLNSKLSIIHGPPGTGKTYTLIELIQQLYEQKLRVLVCGPSNISVDTIIERLDGKLPYDKIVRIGHPSRLLTSIQKYSLDYKLSTNSDIMNDIKAEIQDNFKKLKKIKNYGEKKEIWESIKFLKKDLKFREKKYINEVLNNSKVIVSTLHGASNKNLSNNNFNLTFDVLIIDEVSQSLEPQCWIPLIYHQNIDKLILAGDNMQLPPTIKLLDNKNNKKTHKYAKILETTLFERLIKLYKNSLNFKQFLNIQYRMNSKIIEFSSKNLYDSKLLTFEKIKDQLIYNINDSIIDNDDTSIPLIWYDTQGGDYLEQEENDSKLNENEALIIFSYIKSLISYKIEPKSIGVISPYNSQVSFLKKLIHPIYPTIEVSTIDGFQGREKDIVLLSLVRSNYESKIGFLKDYRRLNVAITRSKYQLLVVGDMETLGNSDSKFLKNWVAWSEDNSEIRYPN